MASSATTSLADRAYERVEEMIVTLELPPGGVFSEIELCERIGIGRTPLREALQRLAGDRLVMALPRRGMMITNINATEYLALLETRSVLDRLIVSSAARKARDAERAFFSRCAENMRRVADASDLEAFMRLDREFDDALEAASRNPYACAAASPLHAHCRRFWTLHRHAGDLETSARLHADIMTAISSGAAEAASRASDALISYLESFTRKALDLE